jgi:glycerol uptake facilitator-like aquaporin
MEMVGTFAMSFFGPAAIVVGLLTPSLSPVQRLFFDALVPGIAIFACIVSFAKYSGAHVNPAVAVSFAASGRFRSSLVIPYILFQFFGCLMAALALRTIFESAVPSAALGSNMLGVGVTPAQGIILEIEEEIILCLIVLSVVSLVRGTAKQGIIVGATLTLMIFTFGPISGGR